MHASAAQRCPVGRCGHAIRRLFLLAGFDLRHRFCGRCIVMPRKRVARARSALAFCLGLICLPGPAAAQSAGELVAGNRVDASTIVERALDLASRQRDSALGSSFEYVTAGTVESLDADGNVTRTETSRRRHYPLEGHFYSELIGRDGDALDHGDVQDEQDRKAEFIREARRHAARRERYDPDQMHVDFDRELMNRYHTTLAGTDIVRGDSCWVIRFVPRAGRLPDKRRIDKALNRSNGHLWITQDDYRVARVTFEMQRPFRWLWGIAGTLRHAAGQFDLQWVRPDLWTLAHSRIEFDVKVLFGMKSIRRRVRSELVDYQVLEAEAP